jgi:Tol biopolymer transport system component
MSGSSVRSGGKARPPRDPYGIGPVGSLLPPIAAATGLAIIAWLSLGLVTGDLRLPGAPGGPNGGPGGVRTPAPSNVVIVDPRTQVPGSIVYVKGGNVWVQSGTNARQVTGSGTASMPSWSPDGASIYYVDTIEEIGLHRPTPGDRLRRYTMQVPHLKVIPKDGSGEPEEIANGRYELGDETWFYWMRQPVLSPDASAIALVSDGPDATKSDVVLQFLDPATGELTNPKLPETLGHQDPVWRADGRLLLYVRNGRDGARGAPSIWRYDPERNRTTALTGPGYLSPSYSRDLRYVAATRTDAFGTDIVVLDARNGQELLRVTDDDRSWAPVWSPKGDAIAFLHMEDGIVDLRLARLEGTGPTWTVPETLNLTSVSGLDGLSRPGWFIPESELPPIPTPAPSASPAGGSTAPSGSATP